MLALRNIILEMIARGADLQATIDRLCLEIEALADGIVCSVLTVDSNGLLHPLSAPSLPNEYTMAFDGLMIGPDVGSCGSAAYLQRPVIVTDIATDLRWAKYKEAALPLNLRACWSTPIFGEDDRVIGTFAFYYRHPRGPTDAEREIVNACIHLCSIALARHDRVLDRERRASIDALTEIPNRSSFARALSRLSCAEPGAWALLILDLDNLKVINDGFGHHAGDRLLQTAAERITSVASPNRAFRIGGDEFAILVQSPEALRNLDEFASSLLIGLCKPINHNGHSIMPRATIGGAVLSNDNLNADIVRQNADFALYHAKETGRGGFVRYWPGLDTRMTRRFAVIRDVDAALREHRVEAYYQPIFHLETHGLFGLEALCRLRMANRGILPAAAFKEATADVRIASELTERMLAIVATDIRRWLEMTIPIDYVSINVSLADFQGGLLDQLIVSAQSKHGLPLEHLALEISENAYQSLRDDTVLKAIQALRSKGLRIALDNFGAGGGLLMPFLTSRVDILKVDKLLVDRLAIGEDGAAVIGGLLHMARLLGIDVVAEGVETEAQSAHLTQLGCPLAQGYFFSKPLDRKMATSFLLAGQKVNISIRKGGQS